MKNQLCFNCKSAKVQLFHPDKWWGALTYAIAMIGGVIAFAGLGCTIIGLLIWPLLVFAVPLFITGALILVISTLAMVGLTKLTGTPKRYKCKNCGVRGEYDK